MDNAFLRSLLVIGPALLASACGLHVPDKSPVVRGSADNTTKSKTSYQAEYEDRVVQHINCEISLGLARATSSWALPWLVSPHFGTAITLTITAEQQSGINAGASIISPFRNAVIDHPASLGGNVVAAQSFTLGLGATAAANATRTETIQWTQRNSDLYQYYIDRRSDCSNFNTGIMLDGDLKIADFIYDKAELARLNNLTATTSVPKEWIRKYGGDIARAPIFNTFTGEINFVGAFGGGVNPSWKLLAVNANTPNSLLSAENTYTSDVIITVGEIDESKFPYQLGMAGQNQHNSRVNANAIATSVQSQSR